ncbi:MAG TPA: gluconate 2-dehydrogenase subunit 3 family protein [Bryobacteraceae bacterium]
MERRELFKILGATAVAAELGLAQHLHETIPAETYTARAFRPEQLAMLNQLCEVILPSDEESPGAGRANVALYLDMFVSFRGREMKQLFEEGVALVDSRSRAQFQKPFPELAASEQDAIVAQLAASEQNRDDAGGRFFRVLKIQTVLGYHYSDIGQRQYMHYRGNTAVAEFPGCQHEGHHAS